MLRRSRMKLGLGAALAAAGLAAAAFNAAPIAASDDDPRPAKVARDAAKANGEPAPEEIEWVRTTRAKFNKDALNADIHGEAGDREVYATQAKGDFEAGYAGGPGGIDQAPPTGKYLIILIDVETGEATEFGLLKSKVDLARFGSVKKEKNG